MGLYLCMDCGQIYHPNYLIPHRDKEGNYMCPSAYCGGTLIDLDEDILESVRILNEKGYRTLNSCSGHMHEAGGMYIQFNPKTVPTSIPKSWYIDNQCGVCIRYTVEGDNFTLERLDNLYKGRRDLLDWAIKLESIDIEVDEEVVRREPVDIPRAVKRELDRCSNNEELKDMLSDIQEYVYDQIYS